MGSKYQMWLTYNGGSEKLRFPVLPETIEIKHGSKNESADIAGLGEVVIKQGSPAITVRFSSFFPVSGFPGAQTERLVPPEELCAKILRWKEESRPVHFLITGTGINMYCAIEDFSITEHGGDIGTIHYSILLKEYREVTARQISIDETGAAAVTGDGTERTDNRAPEKTYTVVKGDTLWGIAKKYLGSGSRYMEIANLNSGIIKNPNLIYAGQIFRLPV